MGDSGPLFLWNGGKDLVSHAEVPPHDSRLVLQHRDQEGVADNVQFFVPQIKPVVFRNIAQEIHRSVLETETNLAQVSTHRYTPHILPLAQNLSI